MQKKKSGKWFNHRNFYTLIVCLFALMPGFRFFEDDLPVAMAKTLYAMGRTETNETLLMIGSVAMNRVEDDRFPDTLLENLNRPDAFSRGIMYDARSLAIARELLMGKRALPASMVYLAQLPSNADGDASDKSIQSGGYVFFETPAG